MPSRYWSRAFDGYVPVTIRSAQQVPGATDLLYDAITARAFPLTLHLGDAMDVSCQTEWDMFAMAMQRGLGAPGSGAWRSARLLPDAAI